MKRGSITVFLALTLVLVLSFIFSLLEGARVYCLKSRAELVSEICMQSMFGNYHAGMWEDYHLLFLDGSWQEGGFSVEKFAARAVETAEENLSAASGSIWSRGSNLVFMELRDMMVNSFQLATDQEGEVFLSQVAHQMQMEAVVDVLDELLNLKEHSGEAENQVGQKDQGWDQAWEAMGEAEEIGKAGGESGEGTGEPGEPGEEVGESGEGNEKLGEGSGESGEGSEKPGEGSGEAGEGAGEPGGTANPEAEQMENPMEYVRELKSSSVLAMVVKDPTSLSRKALKDPVFIGGRQLMEGNWSPEADTGMMDRLWLHYYIQNYFSDYTAEREKGAKEKVLDYEMEYLLAGKESDVENLETVACELLGIREAMNFVTILRDAEKKSLALGIATAAVGFTGIAPLVKAVQIGILLAWAYVESVLDVRALLSGKKVPFLKRTDQWSSDLRNCRGTIESSSESEDKGQGLTYTQYLQMLLFLLSGKTISYRCMDLIERNEGVSMDHMLQAVEGTFAYEARPLFWNWNFVAVGGWKAFSVKETVRMTYGGK